MQTGILHHLLSLLGDPCGTLLDLARRGFGAIRSLLRSGRGLIAALIKKAVSFVMSDVAPAAASARNKLQESLESLKRRVQAAMAGRPAEPEIEADEPEIEADEPSAEAVIVERVDETVVKDTAAPPVDTAAASCAEETCETPPAPLPSAGGLMDSSSQGLVALAPAIRHALVRALSRPRPPRPHEAMYAGSSA